MTHLNPAKAALAVGVFLSGWHALWSLLVVLKWAQPLYDFILWAHMIHLQLTIGPFEPVAAATLVVVTFAIGSVIGYVFTFVWNWFHRSAT